MPTVILDPPPAEFEALLERRRGLGLDRWDEVWKGVLHMNPPPSREHERIASRLHRLLGPYADAAGLDLLGGVGIGAQADNRVPDLVLQRPRDASPQWQQTVAVAVEIRSPNDETFDKLGFYADHQVDELVIVDPQARTVEWLALEHGGYRATEHSRVIGLTSAELADQLDWH
jgi:Uma2 family endonuclease